jgi:hypothetical protein
VLVAAGVLVAGVCDVLSVGLAGATGTVPAAVSTPKLPVQPPSTFMNNMPNQPPSDRLSSAIFRTLALALARPVVASPAVPLLSTEALPEAAFTETVLLIAVFVVLVTAVLPLVDCDEIPSPRAALVAPAGAFTMKPTHVPITFTKTTNEFLATTVWPVRFTIFMFVMALPVVALPPAVLLETLASPEVAVVDTLFLIVVFAAFATEVFPLLAGDCAASKSARVVPGSRMSPSRLPLMFIVPTKVWSAPTKLFTMFTMLAVAVASPVVALPAAPLPVIVASPLWASSAILLLIWESVSVFRVRPCGVLPLSTCKSLNCEGSSRMSPI